MKKIIVLLGLLLVGLFLIGCGVEEIEEEGEEVLGEEDQGLVGEAVYVGGKLVRVVCEQFDSSSANDVMTGNKFCRSKKYDTCEGITTKVATFFYSSTDESCSGDIQMLYFSFPETPCYAELGLNPLDENEDYGCQTYESSAGQGTIVVEPASGDVKIEENYQYVNCCKIVG